MKLGVHCFTAPTTILAIEYPIIISLMESYLYAEYRPSLSRPRTPHLNSLDETSSDKLHIIGSQGHIQKRLLWFVYFKERNTAKPLETMEVQCHREAIAMALQWPCNGFKMALKI